MTLLSNLVETDDLAILLITHDLGVAGERADEIAVLREGKLVRSGRTDEVVAHPGDQYKRESAAGVVAGLLRGTATARLEYRRTLPADASVVVDVIVGSTRPGRDRKSVV